MTAPNNTAKPQLFNGQIPADGPSEVESALPETPGMVVNLAGTPTGPSALPGGSVGEWLLSGSGAREDGSVPSLPELIDELCQRIEAQGVPLLRVTCSIPITHPQVFTRGIIWKRGEGSKMFTREHGIQTTAAYLDSPVYLLHQGAAAIRRRLDGPNPQLDFGIVREVKEMGATDYLAVALRFTRGLPSFISWTTDRPGGFTTRELALLFDLTPLISMRAEVEAARMMTRDLLRTYLGKDAATRVIKGQFKRGSGSEIDAAIWFCDLRGFTRMSDGMEPMAVIETLNQFFDALAEPIQKQGGEILKFLGDGMLAVFRSDDGQAKDACNRALDAALDGFASVANINRGRMAEGEQPLRFGIGLHFGKVVYGNIGSANRLDFTVIGRAVNEVSRIEAMTKTLERPLLASSDFAEVCQRPELVSLGFHALRGVKEPREVFGIDPVRLPG